MDKLLNLIGLAKKAGKLEVGEEPVGAAARSKHARLILIASDAADNTRRRALHFGEAGECICLEIPPTKEDLAHRQETAASGRTAARSRRKGQERGKEREQAPERRGQARTHARRERKGAPRRGKAARGKALCPFPPREEGQGQHQERQ